MDKEHFQFFLSCSHSWQLKKDHKIPLGDLISSYEKNLCDVKNEVKIEIEFEESAKEKELNSKKEDKDKRVYKCDECGKELSNKKNLTLHKLLHTGERPFTCQTCGKAFLCQQYLKRHERLHTDVRPFVCEICNKSFCWKNQLQQHKWSHTNKKPFQCSFCEMSFATKQDLKRHEVVHSLESKPYQCGKCTRSFHSKYKLNLHDFVHSGKSSHFCELCGVYFPTAPRLRNHVFNVHQKKSKVSVEEIQYVKKLAKPSALECDKCKKMFEKEEDLMTHKSFHCYFTVVEILKAKKQGLK